DQIPESRSIACLSAKRVQKYCPASIRDENCFCSTSGARSTCSEVAGLDKRSKGGTLVGSVNNSDKYCSNALIPFSFGFRRSIIPPRPLSTLMPRRNGWQMRSPPEISNPPHRHPVAVRQRSAEDSFHSEPTLFS